MHNSPIIHTGVYSARGRGLMCCRSTLKSLSNAMLLKSVPAVRLYSAVLLFFLLIGDLCSIISWMPLLSSVQRSEFPRCILSAIRIRPRPLAEYTPVCMIGELCIYRHKSELRLYATTHLSGVFNKVYTLSDSDKLYYMQAYRAHWDAYICGKIDFEDVTSEKIFLRVWDA